MGHIKLNGLVGETVYLFTSPLGLYCLCIDVDCTVQVEGYKERMQLFGLVGGATRRGHSYGGTWWRYSLSMFCVDKEFHKVISSGVGYWTRISWSGEKHGFGSLCIDTIRETLIGSPVRDYVA